LQINNKNPTGKKILKSTTISVIHFFIIMNIFGVTLIVGKEVYLDSAMAQNSSIHQSLQSVSIDSCPAGSVFSEITDKCEDPCPEGYAISVVTGVCELLPEKLMTEQQESQTTSLQDLTLYENNDLDLRFSYPSNWGSF